MDLFDKIEGTRFLGREFLVWLWYESERLEGVLEVRTGESVELWLEEQLTLVYEGLERAESKLKAAMPSASPEAKEALRQGKMPTKAKIGITRGPQTWGFLFQADTLSVAGVSVPAMITEDTDERFYERIHLIEELESLLAGLYERFVTLRTSDAWPAEADAIRGWIRE